MVIEERNQHKAALAACFTLVSRLYYFSTLKMEAICSSETSRNQHARGSTCCVFHVGFSLGLLFEPKDGGDMLLRNFKKPAWRRQSLLAASRMFHACLKHRPWRWRRIHASAMSVQPRRITWRYIPEKWTLQNPNVFVVIKGSYLHLINRNLFILHH
jgi:hypothetical protein